MNIFLVYLSGRCDGLIRMQRFNLSLYHGSFQTLIQVVEPVHLQRVLPKLLDVGQYFACVEKYSILIEAYTIGGTN